MTPNRQTRWILGLAVLLAGAFWMFAALTPWRAELAETNFQANLIRLQAFLFDPPARAVLAGSSMSGRLLPQYFQGSALAPVANLGLDGSGAVFGLDLVLQRPPAIVLVEENSLLKPRDANEELLDSTVQSALFRAARHIPLLRARSRPSSVLYSWLKLRSQGREAATSAPPEAAPKPAEAAATLPRLDAATQAVLEKLRGQVSALQAKGSEVVLVRLPSGNLSPGVAPALAGALAREFHLREIDLAGELSRRGYNVVYTDGLHLNPPSAVKASQVLAEILAAK